jgi:ribosomal protein S24E
MTFNTEITEKIEQPLTSRILLKGAVTYDTAPPNFTEIRKQVASAMKVNEDLVVVQSLKSLFGTRSSSVEIHVYKAKEALDSFESKVILARNKPRVKKSAVAASK